jgi:hypothetical protein
LLACGDLLLHQLHTPSVTLPDHRQDLRVTSKEDAMAGLGPVGELGPGGAHAGRVIGLLPALETAGRYSPVAPVLAGFARRKVRDYNDDEAPAIVGSTRGRLAHIRPPTAS